MFILSILLLVLQFTTAVVFYSFKYWYVNIQTFSRYLLFSEHIIFVIKALLHYLSAYNNNYHATIEHVFVEEEES